jgi:hypothetical protein
MRLSTALSFLLSGIVVNHVVARDCKLEWIGLLPFIQNLTFGLNTILSSLAIHRSYQLASSLERLNL